MLRGIITDIQRFSMHDGNGIRTTVFFKGCNMSCPWCHNPETYKIKPELRFIETKCIGCGSCYRACRYNALCIKDGNRIYNKSACTMCGECVTACWPEALVVTGKEMTVSDIMDEVMQDKPYYDNSGGGVTISGGEPFLQHEFLDELVDSLIANGIHTAIESNMSFAWDIMHPILEKLDLVMLDIKVMDDKLHMEMTGRPLKDVIDNVARFDKLGIPYIVRTPIIPNAIYSEESILETAHFLSTKANIMYYELLNYNPLAESKFNQLGKDYIIHSHRLKREDFDSLLKKINEKYPNLVVKYQMG